MIHLRALEVFDEPFLPRFLSLAAHEEETEVVLSNPALALYVANWGRRGDCAVVAEDLETRAIVGMAWARFWTKNQHGFGWIDELTPELAVAIEPEFQGQGIGTRLIEALKCRLRAVSLTARWDTRTQRWVTASIPVEVDQPEMQMAPHKVALNVRDGSPAIRLYERAEFAKVDGSERQNRTGSVSFNMAAPLQNGSWRRGQLDRSIHTNPARAPDNFVAVDTIFGLRLDLFSSEEQTRFIALMSNLPGAGEGMWPIDGFDGRTSWSYFGPPPGKTAIYRAHLAAHWHEGEFCVRGDLTWEEWCQWENAFLENAPSFPHALLTTSFV